MPSDYLEMGSRHLEIYCSHQEIHSRHLKPHCSYLDLEIH